MQLREALGRGHEIAVFEKLSEFYPVDLPHIEAHAYHL
jgi:hypothetical protein